MKVKHLFFFFGIILLLNTAIFAERTITKEDQEIIDQYSGQQDEYGNLTDTELETIARYGNEDDANEAREILAYRNAKSALLQQLAQLEAALQKLPSISQTDTVKNKIKKQQEETQQELNRLEAKEKGKQQERIKKSISNRESKNAQKSGDPVKISEGSYEQSETDISAGTNQKLEIKRFYSSENPIISSFGYGWTTNVDQRIILGIDGTAQPLYEKSVQYENYIYNAINQSIQQILSLYQISSIDNYQGEINSTYNPLISDYESAAYEAERLSMSEEQQFASDRAGEVQSRKSDILQFLSEETAYLEQLRNEYETAKQNTAYYYNRKIKSEERHQKNNRVLFAGTDSCYEQTNLNTITVIDEEGYPHLLYETNENSGIWNNSSDTTIIECLKTPGGYLLKQSNGEIKDFNSNGFLIKITDRNSNSISILRDNSEHIKTITNTQGEALEVFYEGSFIKQIQNRRDVTQKVSFSYSGNFLKSVTDIDGDTVGMKYNANGKMCSLNKCDGSQIQFLYGQVTNSHKYLTTQTINEEGYSEYFIYNPAAKQTIYKDHDGNEYKYTFDDNHRTVNEIQPDGTTILHKYDENGNCIQTITNGNKTTFKYDSKENITQIIYGNGSSEFYAYDNFNLPVYYQDCDNVIYEYIRDSRGNITEYKTGGKTVYTQEFDSKGQIIKHTEYADIPIITEYEYDSFGNCIAKKTANLKTSFEYDNQNRPVKILQNGKETSSILYEDKKTVYKDCNGLETTYITNNRKDITQIIQKDTVLGIVHKKRIEYDKRHLPVKIFVGDEQHEELISEYLYTPEGKIKEIKWEDGQTPSEYYEYQNGQINKITFGNNSITYQYNWLIKADNKKLLTITDPLGHSTLYEYNSQNNLISQTDANANVIRNEWSNAGRLKKTQNPYGGFYEYEYDNCGNLKTCSEENSAGVITTYNPNGSIKTQTDQYGNTVNFYYNNQGLVACQKSNSSSIWYEYDELGRIIFKIIGNANDISSAIYYAQFEYSNNNRTVTFTEGGKYKTVYELDAFGNIIKQTDGNGNSKHYEYDYQNNLTTVYDGYGNKTIYEYTLSGAIKAVILPDQSKTNYEYNELGQIIKIEDDCGIIYQADYDKAGRLIKEKKRGDCEKSYEYDNAGRILKILWGGQVIETYSYEQQGRKVTITDGNNSESYYNYDTFGRLKKETNKLGFSQEYFYDSEGNLVKQKNFDGTVTSITYSQDRTIRTVNYSDGTQECFVYDAIGNIIEIQNQYEKTKYEYDKGGRLIFQKDITTGEEICYEYDAAGNRTRLLSSTRETCYSYGADNELKKLFDNKQRVSVQLKYDKNGRETLRLFGNGITEQTCYDKAGRVSIKYQKNSSGEIVWGEGYIYSDSGKRTATVDINARVTLYEYDKQGRISTVYYPYTKEQEALLKKEAQDNGLTEKDGIGVNKYLSIDEKAALSSRLNEMHYTLAHSLTTMQIFIKETYQYDKNGNRIKKETPLGTIEYTYNKENQLVSSGSHEKPFINYKYDICGNLLSEESAGKSVSYAYNSQNRLIHCEIIDKTEKNFASTKYAYDAFGRRIIIQDFDQPELRSQYDGFTFDIIKQSPSFSNGTFTDAYETGIHYDTSSHPTGDRYRFIADSTNDGNRYFYLDDDNYKIKNDRYQGERTQFSIDGNIAAQVSLKLGADYFTTDLLGSVKTATDNYEKVEQFYSYDVFGSLVQGELSGSSDFGYLGKQLDSTASLYNYGYRDYNPCTARFTTVDPIRDGPNWFTYCNSDPVNHIGMDMGEYDPSKTRDAYYYIKNSAEMNDLMGKQYSTEADNVYVCTTFVEEALNKAGYDSKDYLPGGQRVVDSVTILEDKLITPESGKNPSEGTYVFYHVNNDNTTGHTGIIHFDKNGNATILHNGSDGKEHENVNERTRPASKGSFDSWFRQTNNPVKYKQIGE